MNALALRTKCCPMYNARGIFSLFSFKNDSSEMFCLFRPVCKLRMWKRAKWDGRELKFSHASSDTMKTFSIELEWREGSQHDWWICQFVWIFSSPYGFKVLFCFIQSLCYFLFLKGNSDCLQFIINEFFFEFCFSFCLNGLMEFGSDFSSILASNWIDLTTYQHDAWAMFCSTMRKPRQWGILYVST